MTCLGVFNGRALRPAFGLVLLVALVLPAQAQWKWKDGRGQTHVSDTPPPRDVPDKDILQRPNQRSTGFTVAAAPATTTVGTAAPAVGAPASAPKMDAELEARKAKQEAEQKAKAKAEADKQAALRAENCQRARQHLATLQSGQRIARINSKGEREVLDDAGREQERQTAQRVAAADCR